MDGFFKFAVLCTLAMCHGILSMDSDGNMVQNIEEKKTLQQKLEELKALEATAQLYLPSQQKEYQQLHKQRVQLEALLELHPQMGSMTNFYFAPVE